MGAGVVTLGRKPDRTVVFGVEDLLVSAEHAAIELRQGHYVVTDDGSTNGTFVNGEQIVLRVLEDGDVIQLGGDGPTLRFVVASRPGETARTLETAALVPRRTLPGLIRRLPGTRWELIALSFERFTTRTRRALLALVLAGLVVIAGLVAWQQWSRARLERTLLDLSAALAGERASRVALEQDLNAVLARYDSLRKLVVAQERRAAAAKPGPAQRDYSSGVALIVFRYGFAERGGTELLRYVADAQGQPVGMPGPDGRFIPAIRFGGEGPPVTHDGTATGFLVDSAGLLLTNRHVAEPWAYENELETIRAHGVDADGRLLELTAYFPPGDQSFRLVVEAMSPRADLALMRIAGGTVRASVVPLAPASTSVRPGDRLRLIGYPTGVYNLLFRVDDTARHEILNRIGDDSRKLVDELARRHLIQPLVTDGSVSDTTGLEVIHTAATTVGGSGGPLLDERQLVVAVQHASVLSPSRGDPFRTQRAVPIRFGWEILPRKTAVSR